MAGAGVVGMACARALQRAGYGVCVADPQPPGSGCSYGNAGVLATDHILPLSRPETLRRLPAMLLGGRAPLCLKWTRVPALLPWMTRFAAACRAEPVARGMRATAALTGPALAAWENELDASGGRDLLSRAGMLSVYRSSASFQHDAGERRRQRELGVAWEIVTGDELRHREPALSDGLAWGVYYPGVAHVLNPQGIVRRLAEAFAADGGTLRTDAVATLTSQPHQVAVRFRSGSVRCRYLVVAAGLDSGALCAGLGLKVPLAAEMGYHVTFPGAQTRLTMPVAAAEDGFIVTPMADHLRAAGTVEFAVREMAPAWPRAALLEGQAARLFRSPLPPAADRWRGSRPTLPDYLPAIGPVPGHPRILAAFGHQHIGLTTAAVTGVLIRELVQGNPPGLDMAPYHPGRFGGARSAHQLA